MYLLYQQLGISALIGALVCVIVMVPLQFVIGKAMGSNSKIISVCVLLVLWIETKSSVYIHGRVLEKLENKLST